MLFVSVLMTFEPNDAIVSSLQVVSPTISSPVCQEQLIEAGKLVDRSVESCVQACLSATEDGELLKQVGLISEKATAHLTLLLHVSLFVFFSKDIMVYHNFHSDNTD